MTPKRQKTAHGEISGNAADVEADVSIINPEIFSPEVLAQHKAKYADAKPYTHGVVTPLCDDARLRAVQAEMREHLTANFKETDLFKVLQTGDLVTIDKADPSIVPKIPELLKLRAAIYSPQFRAMVQEMTGCAPLTDRIDCSANVYPRSGHLLCHDDVIGTRCISYIIYLTDPDEGWTERDGGALELYPVIEPGTPAVDPTTELLPAWNSMAFFTVQPGRSFHSVQEVFAEDKPRLSISGWYHAAEAPKGSEHATLTQLQTRTGGDDDIEDFTPFPAAIAAIVKEAAAAEEDKKAGGGQAEKNDGDGEEHDEDEDCLQIWPDKEDLEYLARWVNPEYLQAENVLQIRAKMEEDSSVQLKEFLIPERAAAIRAATRVEDSGGALGDGRVPNRAAGIGGGWRAVGPTHKQRYLAYDPGAGADDAAGRPGKDKPGKDKPGKAKGKGESAGAILHAIREELFASEPFARLLAAMTNLRPTAFKGEVRRFRPGLDYTVAHHGILTVDPRLDATLCVVDDEGDIKSSAWDFGECGGFECYIAADEEGDAADAATAAVYKAQGEDDEDELLSVSASFNTLSLVHRDEGLMRFVKYVSHLAPSSRWDVAMQYTVEGIDDSDDEEDEDEDGGEEDDEGEELE